jgi:hypothetical protein
MDPKIASVGTTSFPLDLGLPCLTGNRLTFQRWSTLPKEQPLEMRPSVNVSTMLAENIGRISLPKPTLPSRTFAAIASHTQWYDKAM